MRLSCRTRRLIVFSCSVAFAAALAPGLLTSVPFEAGAQSVFARPFGALRWRLIGPFRAGRTVAVAGVPARPGVFYMAPNDGGVWKTIDYGRTWQPIFDAQDTGSIGALAVAPSDPDVVYAGSGEGLRRPDLSTGDGMYKSTDAGATWSHLGLRDGRQIAQIAVDPRDPNRLYVAVVGHPFGPNAQRGLYRSTDGGASFQKVLGSGNDAGAVSVAIDPKNPDTVYAALWASRNGPWNLVKVYERYDSDGLFKSTDGGTTWTQLHGGLPAKAGRIGISVSPVDSARLYAIVEVPGGCGVYRSSDAGASWTRTGSEERVCGRAEDFAGITADPQDRDVVYSANTTMYRSSDGGTSWTGIKGAPGGDDYHTVWIDPSNANVIIVGSDQGATISVDRGATWSSWYNQPTAQFYHVIADDRFPYRVFGGQQESGSAEVWSRGNDGAIGFREFHPVGTEEYGYVAPDPLHPWLIYGGKVTVYDERTGQTQDVSPTYDRRAYRFDRTNPLVWNRVDKRELYLGLNVVFATRDGAHSWRIISPDLTRTDPGEPSTLAGFTGGDPLAGKHRGVIYSLAPSYLDKNEIWAGTDDGLVWLTRDGGVGWRNVTPPALGPWSRVTQIDASHFDTGTAYVSVSRQRLDDQRPYVYRTRDGGKTWTSITGGLPDEPVNTVREDTERRGLLFAGTERTVYVSIDDGAHWSSLQDGLPPTSVRDLAVHGDDLVAGTHGRSFWILDDIEPLREESAALENAAAHLYRPERALRVRYDTNTDTPLPPEEPVAANPPDGAIVDYTLGSATDGDVTLAVYDASGRLVRRFSSRDQPAGIGADINIPAYWVREPRVLDGTPGDHRFVWDLRYPAPQAFEHDYPISAIVHDTPHAPQGALALPGSYTVVLRAGGRRYVQPLQVGLDPRVHVSAGVLRLQFVLASRLVAAMNRTYELALATRSRAGVARYRSLNGDLAALLDDVEGADAGPALPLQTAIARALRSVVAGTPALDLRGEDEP